MEALTLARFVVDHCLKAGIYEFVFCPGARDAPMAIALAERADALRLWHHFDERSAAFFALGRVIALARPVAIVTTSGTAASELLPACIEAHYQARPLLLISCDRPLSFRRSGAPQCIDQSKLFSGYVDQSIDVTSPMPIFEGWLGQSPRHLNLQFGEPLLAIHSAGEPVGSHVAPPNPTARPRVNVAPLGQFLRPETCWRGLVVLLGGIEPEERESVHDFLRQLAAPVIADPTSGLRESLGSLHLAHGDQILKHSPPGKILRLGEVPIGRFWRDLESLPQVAVLSVSPIPYPGLAREAQLIHASVAEAIDALGPVDGIGDPNDLLPKGRKLASQVDEILDRYPESEQGMLRTLSQFAAFSDLVYLGNSLPIREWSLCAQSHHPYQWIRANRGANGIDGQLATFLGIAAETEEAWAILGDLTTLYDCNALSLAKQCQNGKRVIAIINNNGGKIFDRLPGYPDLPNTAQQLIRQADHQANFSGLAQLWQCHHQQIRSIEDFDQPISPGTTLLEVIPCNDETFHFWRDFDALTPS